MKTSTLPPRATILKKILRMQPAGFLLFMPLPELIMLLLMSYLFYTLYSCCTADSRCADATDAFINYLKGLQQKFSGPGIDPEQERANLEPLLNKLKLWKPGGDISQDSELRYLFVRNYNLVTEWPLTHTPEDRIAWTRLTSLMRDFYESYFARMQVVAHRRSLNTRSRQLFGLLVPVRHHAHL
jgi:hypothetical protein